MGHQTEVIKCDMCHRPATRFHVGNEINAFGAYVSPTRSINLCGLHRTGSKMVKGLVSYRKSYFSLGFSFTTPQERDLWLIKQKL